MGLVVVFTIHRDKLNFVYTQWPDCMRQLVRQQVAKMYIEYVKSVVWCTATITARNKQHFSASYLILWSIFFSHSFPNPTQS